MQVMSRQVMVVKVRTLLGEMCEFRSYPVRGNKDHQDMRCDWHQPPCNL